MRKIVIRFLLPLLWFSQIANGNVNATATGFIPNKGQWDPQVLYRLNIPGGALFLENKGFSYSFMEGMESNHGEPEKQALQEQKNFRSHCVRMSLLGAMEGISPEPENPSITKYNFYLGRDQEKWVSGLSSYQNVRYNNAYKNVDMKLYIQNNGFKYDFIIRKNGIIDKIRMKYDGATNITIRNKKLFIQTSLGEIIEEEPVAWQWIDGQKIPVSCSFIKHTDGSIGFLTQSYNKNYELTIDPKIVFATYSGSIDDNWGYTGTYDYAGNGYAAGVVFGPNFQTTTGVSQKNYGGGKVDIGIIKFSPDGKQALYITYLGGSNNELPHSIIVNQFNELIVFGTTGSTDFPVTTGCYSGVFKGGNAVTLTTSVNFASGTDIFVSRLSENGQKLLASTLIGGTKNDGLNIGGPKDLIKNYADEIRGAVWVDRENNIYVGTSTLSSDFPSSQGVFQPAYGGGNQDGVVFKMNGNLTKLIWASFIGGEKSDGVFFLVVDNRKNIIVTGGTKSSAFPVSQSAWKKNFSGGTEADGFVSKIDSSGKLVASTYIGTDKYDQSFIVGSDNDGFIYSFGQSNATGNEFLINSTLGVTGGNQFLMKLNPDLSGVIWSSNFGKASGVPDISPSALLVDYCNKIYACGWGGSLNTSYNGGKPTSTTGLKTTPTAIQSTTDGNDFYLYVIDKDATQLEYASFLGGNLSHEHVDGGTSRFDRKGVIYQAMCAGCGNGGGRDDLPVTPGAYSATNNSSNCNIALVKIDFEAPVVVASFTLKDQTGQNLSSPIVCAPFNVKFNNTSVNGTLFKWEINGDSVSNNQSFDYTFNKEGKYKVRLTAISPASCNLKDTISMDLTVLSKIDYPINDISACKGNTIELGPKEPDNPYFSFLWYPSTGLSNPQIRQPKLTVSNNATYNLIIGIGACRDTLTQNIIALGQGNSSLPDLLLCAYDSVRIGPLQAPFGASGFKWKPGIGLSDSTALNPFLRAWTDSPNSRTYTLSIEYPGCMDLISRKITISENQPDLSSKVCHGKNITLGPAQPPKDALSYSWSPLTDLNDANILNPTAKTETSKDYKLFIKGTYCNDTLIHKLDVVGSKLSPLADIEACPNDSIKIGLSAPINTSGVAYHWYPPNDVSDSAVFNPKILVGQSEKQYRLIVKWPVADCLDTLFQKVASSSPKAGFTYSIIPDCSEMIVQFKNSSEDYSSLLWKFSNGKTSNLADPSVTLPYEDNLKTTLYALKGQCKDSADNNISKKLDEYYVTNTSNAFSPDNDQNKMNECFSPALQLKNNNVDTTFVKCSELLIYDRWGIKVFDSVSDKKFPCWDGKDVNGKNLPEGYYFYRYIFRGIKTEETSGNVYLIRD